MNTWISDRESLRKKFLAVYFAGLMLPFLIKLPTLLGLSVAYTVQDVYRSVLVFVLGIAVTGLWLTGEKISCRLRADGWLLAAAFGWMVLVFLVHRYSMENAEPVLLRGLLAWMAFYPFGFLLSEEEAKKGLAWIACAWAFVMTILALIGIWCVVTRTGLQNLSGVVSYGMIRGRLTLGIWTTSSTENLMTAIILVVIALLSARGKLSRIVSAVVLAVLYLAVILTDGRNGMISLGLFLGILLFVVIYHRSQKKLVGFAAGAAVLLVCVLAVYNSSLLIQKPFSNTYDHVASLRESVLGLESTAEDPEIMAGEEEDSKVTHRDIAASDSSLIGRVHIWQESLEALTSNENNVLLFGTTPFEFHTVFHRYSWANHMHNIYLQVAVEWGLVGAAIMAAFLILFAIAALKLIFAPGLPLWVRALPVPAITILVSELVDSFTMIGGDNVALFVLFLFMGLTIAYSRRLKQ